MIKSSTAVKILQLYILKLISAYHNAIKKLISGKILHKNAIVNKEIYFILKNEMSFCVFVFLLLYVAYHL